MIKLFLVIFTLLFSLTGCISKEDRHNQMNESDKVTSITASDELDNSYFESIHFKYKSLNDYSEEIGNGTTMTIPEFRINEDQLTVTFEMTFSPEIYEKVVETEKPLYVAITELNQETSFITIIDEVHPPYYEVTNTIAEDEKINVALNFDLIKQPNTFERKELLNPSNYQLVFLNEDLEIVAVYIY